MFGAVPTPSSGGMALAQSPLSLAGNPAVGGGGEAGHSSSPGYPNYMSLYAVQQGMAGLSLDGWGAAAAASAAASCDAYGYSVFAPPPLPGAEPAHGQGLLLGSASSPAAVKAAATAAGAQQTSSPTGSAGLQQDDLRTVFVTGFPPDVRGRELHNLMRYLPGYEACQLTWKGAEPQGFALFTSAAAAHFAVELVGGAHFDDGGALRAELAAKNMSIKADDPTIIRASQPSPLLTPAELAAAAGLPAPSTPNSAAVAAAAAATATAHNTAGLLPGSPHVGGSPASAVPRQFKVPLRPQSFSPVTNLRDNPPCNTLFIGNLSDGVSEAELRALMSTQPGYRQMKVVKGSRNTTAFVEFANVASAMLVHQTLLGAVLQSSDRGGVRLQFSKNPFGRRDDCPRDQGGAPAQAQAHAAAAAAAAMSAAAAAAAAAAASGVGGMGQQHHLAHLGAGGGVVVGMGALQGGGADAQGLMLGTSQLGAAGAGLPMSPLTWALPLEQHHMQAQLLQPHQQHLMAASVVQQQAAFSAAQGLGHGGGFAHHGVTGVTPPGL